MSVKGMITGLILLWNLFVGILYGVDKEKAKRKYKNAVVDDATIDDILLLYVKGEQAK